MKNLTAQGMRICSLVFKEKDHAIIASGSNPENDLRCSQPRYAPLVPPWGTSPGGKRLANVKKHTHRRYRSVGNESHLLECQATGH